MGIKKKLILIGICVVIVIAVFTVNVVKRMNEETENKPENFTVKENVITRAEAYRLLSYLEYNKTKREALVNGITYTEEQMSGWYDTYVNAVWKMGLIEEKVAKSPLEALSYGECKELIDHLIMKNADYQQAYDSLSFDFVNSEEDMLTLDFIEIYEALLTTVSEEDRLIQEETLLVLGRELTEDGKDRIVTDLGKYYYEDAKSYEQYYEQLLMRLENGAADQAEITKMPNELSDDLAEEKAEAVEPDDLVDQYLDKGIKVLVCDQEIIYITSVTEEQMVVHNVWIEKGEALQVDTFVNGLHKSFQARYKLSSPIEAVVGDITIENQRIVRISVKPDMIQGKVLQTGDDFIEVEGYGKLPLEENYRIYKIYGELSMEPTGSILVGYESTNFIVSGGKISAALITENIKAENIRVLLQTSGYKDIYHKKVEFTSSVDFTISSKEKETAYKAGDIVTVEPGGKLLSGGRITIKASSEDGKIEILSIERASGNPKYRGAIEIAEDENGLLVINELSLEEYLYSVIPSEMPTYYGLESLKVQAVCARSYAYNQLMANSLSKYGAHVDDSVSYQVYNNIAENEDSILAVKDTYGQVIKYDGKIITAYYFSTSCGHTAEVGSVWATNTSYPYLSGKLLAVEDEDSEGAEGQNEIAAQYEDLSSEDIFREFIEENNLLTYDGEFNWYRWKVTMKVKEIKKVIDQNLAERYNANPELILTMTKKAEGGKEAEFESIPVDTVGTIVDISVLKRESSGIISELLIEGSKNTIKVKTEYNIRTLLAPAYDTILRQDDTEVENLKLLPSAFFTFDKKKKSGKLSSITLIGGGYGHGVGMSQNGVKALADAGKEYEAILTYFYEGTVMGFIYE